jgi:hypothetical protein
MPIAIKTPRGGREKTDFAIRTQRTLLIQTAGMIARMHSQAGGRRRVRMPMIIAVETEKIVRQIFVATTTTALRPAYAESGTMKMEIAVLTLGRIAAAPAARDSACRSKRRTRAC